MGKIIKVSGPLVVADGMADANMADVVRVGPQQLIGEILNMTGDRASIQVYEETSGLGPGAEVETTGAPVRLRLRTLTPAPRPDGKDVLLLNCDCLDAQGRPVPDASPMVHFVTNELGRVLATGSDVSDHTPVTSPDRKMRAGLISLLIGAGEKKGILRVYAYADGLEGARLDVML